MAEKQELPTTQRAYTLRLRGIDGDAAWREALWATHEAVNRGAKVFGEWLLTLRGGLCHTLADQGPDAQRKDRRILLALSWLSVEDEHGAPKEFVITDRVAALRDILAKRGVKDPEAGQWMQDCEPSLKAEIRDDARWVNRSAAFDAALPRLGGLDRAGIWDFLGHFFGEPSDYMAPETPAAEGDTEASPNKRPEEKNLVQAAGHWLVARMGEQEGADFGQIMERYRLLVAAIPAISEGSDGDDAIRQLAEAVGAAEKDLEGLQRHFSYTGSKRTGRFFALLDEAAAQRELAAKTLAALREETAEQLQRFEERATERERNPKGRRPYSDAILQEISAACGFDYLNPNGKARHPEYCVMLDHAARRVNVAHSWIKNAEAERAGFDKDAARMDEVPPEARQWLDKYCKERTGESGAVDAYRIRRRAIDAWEKVVSRWSDPTCATREDRVAAARDLQADPEIDKFGDIQLFEALAEDDALCVWKPDGKPSPKPLQDYVFARDAEAKKQRFKVPAYRHPDPLRHPVFVDFGYSRWSVDFSAHRAASGLADAEKLVEERRQAVRDLEAKAADAKTDARREAATKKVQEAKAKLSDAERQRDELADRHRVELGLWTGSAMQSLPLRWSCKRLTGDLALRQDAAGAAEPTTVPRADRLGRAAAGVGERAPVSIASLFGEKHWNGRLQAPRRQLDALAKHVERHGWDAKAQTMLRRIRWLLSFSASLQPVGPWHAFARALGLKIDPQYWPHAEANKKRAGHGRITLSRLPGLRVLSVDLGHRFAAACAVWEAISGQQLEQACAAAKVPAPDAGSLALSLPGVNRAGKPTHTLYRRIGPELLPDNTPHPAPWARLDRQFLIKLQGEDERARKASPAELAQVQEFERWGGRVPDPEARLSSGVDQVMSRAVNSARLALARHGRRACIARDLIANEKIVSGDRRIPLDDEGRIELRTDTLEDWHALACDGRWDDAPARDLWNQHIAALPGGVAVAQRQQAQPGEEPDRAQRRKEEEELRKRLEPLARTLEAQPALRQSLHKTWGQRWEADDAQWRKRLRWLSRWLMPRGKARGDTGIRHVGGLSLTRLSTLTEFRRKVQVGYFTRQKPDGSRAEIAKQFGQKTLDTLERLKDNRVKQLASRIVEAALGVGRETRTPKRDVPRPQSPIDDPRYAACHAVVIENLTSYRPEETRTRRENRNTMDWKSAETRKHLADACVLHGLHLRDVNPQYTSRQDSRTGAPGLRCVAAPASEFLDSPFWKKQLSQAQKRVKEKKAGPRDQLLIDLAAKLGGLAEPERQKLKPLILPLRGGDLFLAASGDSKGIQADLNGAANIGLRALLDPDFAGKWWYVPCDPATRAPKAEKVKGSIVEKLGPLAALPEAAPAKAKRGKNEVKPAKAKQVVNVWRDPAAAPIGGASIGEVWRDTKAYWADAEQRVVERLRQLNALDKDDFVFELSEFPR